ncbi:hypothetical protein EPIB1_528 [Tritonibacter mobilis]|nr:hypothetical protein EPIB1_528 [Tritonibacter mobilis]
METSETGALGREGAFISEGSSAHPGSVAALSVSITTPPLPEH